MTDFKFDVEAVHSCGHKQRHTGGSASGDMTWLLGYWSREKCSNCRPMCDYCHRSGDREKMLITEQGDFCNQWCRNQWGTPTHYAEHNDIRIPVWLQEAGWSDRSWHNDLCARSEYDLPNGAIITVWVDRDTPEEREAPSCCRYSVVLVANEDRDSEEDEVVYAGESADDAQAAIRELMVRGGVQ